MVLKKRVSSKTKSTRKQIIDVARKLFAKIGAENTTMNDIADSAGKGRRTLYLYFKNKEEILNAVIDYELDTLYKVLLTAKNVDINIDDRLLNFMHTHLESMRRLVLRNGTLRADFFRDIWLVERARAEFDRKEAILIEDMLEEGVKKGVFDVPDIKTMSMLLVNATKGLEVPFISGWLRHKDGREFDIVRKNVTQLIFNGIRKK